MTPNAARQQAFRERKAQRGEQEVRGIFARPEEAERIRRYARRVIQQRKPA